MYTKVIKVFIKKKKVDWITNIYNVFMILAKPYVLRIIFSLNYSITLITSKKCFKTKFKPLLFHFSILNTESLVLIFQTL